MSIRKIDDSMRDGIAGGATCECGNDHEKPYEVIDDKSGKVVFRCRSVAEAKGYAELHNYGAHEQKCDEVKGLGEAVVES